ncbi:MAG: hypothetical protein LBP31_00310 [Holosporales bacterium]|jgi:hypothetical protein|nr:hypothetical protein [Holosporales bacterium]
MVLQYGGIDPNAQDNGILTRDKYRDAYEQAKEAIDSTLENTSTSCSSICYNNDK